MTTHHMSLIEMSIATGANEQHDVNKQRALMQLPDPVPIDENKVLHTHGQFLRTSYHGPSALPATLDGDSSSGSSSSSRKTDEDCGVVVNIAIAVKSVSHINVTSATFKAAFTIRAVVELPESCKVPGKVGKLNCLAPDDSGTLPFGPDTWTPRLFIANMVDQWTSLPCFVRDYRLIKNQTAGPKIEFWYRVHNAKFHFDNDRSVNFPFDTHNLGLEIQSRHSGYAITLRVKNAEDLRFSPTPQPSEAFSVIKPTQAPQTFDVCSEYLGACTKLAPLAC